MARRRAFLGPGDGGVEIGDIQDKEAAQRFLCLSKRPVLYPFLAINHADGRRGMGGLQPVSCDQRACLSQRADVGAIEFFLGCLVFGRHLRANGRIGV